MVKAIFLGTFDPPHTGHYSVVKEALKHGKELGFDVVHVIPSSQNPNKRMSTKFSYRYMMCMHTFADLSPNVLVDDIEDNIEHTYTYEIIDFIKSEDKYIGPDFWWIITTETYQELLDGKWKESERLLNENKFLVLYTEDNNDYIDTETVKFRKMNSLTECHSTYLRELLKNHRGLCPVELNVQTFEYILENELYE